MKLMLEMTKVLIDVVIIIMTLRRPVCRRSFSHAKNFPFWRIRRHSRKV
ncbi:hypothetical protein [Enterobacter sp. BNK-34]